jgi:hypothetical protein
VITSFHSTARFYVPDSDRELRGRSADDPYELALVINDHIVKLIILVESP